MTEANQIRETGGPTQLTVAAVADGQVIKRVGSDLVGFSDLVEASWCKGIADAAAATATGESPFYRAAGPVTIVGMWMTLLTALAGNDVNNFSIIIRKRSSAGTLLTTPVTFANTVANGGYAALVPKSLAPAATTLVLGDFLSATITKLGTGQIVPISHIAVTGTRT